ADLNGAVQRDPALLSALRLRGIALRLAERFSESVADFQTILDTGGQLDDTVRAELLYQQGLSWQAAEEHERALETLRKATSATPGLGAAYFSMSLSHGALRKFDAARQSLNSAIAADPSSSGFLLARANMHLAEAQYLQAAEEGDPAPLRRKAHADFEKAVEVNPHDDS